VNKPRAIFIEVDLVQAEWVVVAHYSEDARMLEILHNKLDPHTRTGELISSAPTDLIVEEDKWLGHETNPAKIEKIRKKLLPSKWNGTPTKEFFFPRTMSIRQGGKKSNHGFNYGLGPNTFALKNGMPEADAKRCYNGYHAAYPGVRSMWKRTKSKLNTDRTLRNCFGEKRVFHDELNDNTMRSAYAFIPQSTVARVTNNGLHKVYHAEKPPLSCLDPLANVHDSIIMQTGASDASMVLYFLNALDVAFTHTCMYNSKEFIIDREMKIGRHWGDMHKVPTLTLESVMKVWDATAEVG